MEENKKKPEYWELPPIEPSTPITSYQVFSLLNDLEQCIGGAPEQLEKINNLDRRCTSWSWLAEEAENEAEEDSG
ncbi:hypothetical protein [Mucilaginibacter sp. SJ]|uniref:hypothetical protein n=1 Tax=Mucilaginibacter sp. SJ TaxID=3029053 RepID=UPI0023A92B78|nr:hypothetical protein [Mucilaginibacter sp. SJ]WEA01820.1 hypothetical protein MusilaSJ_02640 [Mucilaginibacter sp. SJ]